MALPAVPRKFTPVEYYRIEQEAAYKSDFYDGEIFDMSGGTGDHSQICSNIVIALGVRLRGGPCRVRESNMRLKVEKSGLRTYPDAAVYCGDVGYDPEDPHQTTALNPTVLVEVLSPSTEVYDRGFKSDNYRSIESLRVFLLISASKPQVEMWERKPDGTWSNALITGLASIVSIPALTIDLPLSELYDGVDAVAR